ncbi:TadE/TadG family type IV pilus assembly protein [Sulfitobacter sp. 1A13191]|uniref:TadE/TadG family type IV pilus assembly protein n=1 Tax=unclassified Sulfitobacter TaxID=196795 RepID=UPI0037465C83
MRALRSLLVRFKGREDGSIAVETVIMLPLMFWAYLAMYSTFDTFRMYNLNQTAAYTVGDAISRETQAIDADYLRGMQQLFEYLTRGTGQTALRVSSIWYDQANDRYHADWSQVRGTVQPLTSDDVRDWHDKLPVMPDNERVTLVETWRDFEPLFKTGLERRDIHNFVFTRPRYAPRTVWSDG